MASKGCFASILWCYWNLPVATFGIKSRKTIWQAVGVFYRGRIKLTVVDAEDLGMIHLFGESMWLAPPMVMLKSGLHPILSYR